ncbi:hypothetical protein VPNG_00982 [Cytospora leucostoma]|uniref:Rhodopsin domain-containing protein n=1 Tax=Cytospora leucostoma TaxID=1230097 RepID=A0A423XMV4_9PEZI|nr:hypothetical protein VPNG_00982 [Cytospora leucostoma]
MSLASTGIDLCAYPAATPPDGVVPNFVNPTSLASATVSICIILTTWAVLTVAARLHTNWGELNAADYFMGAGAITTITYTGLIISLHKYDRHQWDVPACWMTAQYMQIIYAHSTVVGPALFFPKCAIFMFYLQIFSVHRSMRISVWIGLVFCSIIYFLTIPLTALYDAPKPGQSWEELLVYLAETNSHSLIYWGIVQRACSAVLDLYICIIPLPVLLKLQMPPKKKLLLAALFATALFGVVASIMSLYYHVKLLESTDSTWRQAQLAICIVAENNVAIVVGCMPAFAKFVKLLSTRISSLRSRSNSHGSNKDSCEAWETPPPLSQADDITALPAQMSPRDYHDLSDTMLLQTQVSIAGGGRLPMQYTEHNREPGIVRTMGIDQQGSQREEHTQSV